MSRLYLVTESRPALRLRLASIASTKLSLPGP